MNCVESHMQTITLVTPLLLWHASVYQDEVSSEWIDVTMASLDDLRPFTRRSRYGQKTNSRGSKKLDRVGVLFAGAGSGKRLTKRCSERRSKQSPVNCYELLVIGFQYEGAI